MQQRIPLKGTDRVVGLTRRSINDRVGRMDESSPHPQESTVPKSTVPKSTVPKSTPPKFVVYFHPRCLSSQDILEMFKQAPSNQVYLQNVVLLQQRPEWLNGTPIVVDTNLGLLYRGTDAKHLVRNMCELQIKQFSNPLPPLPPPPPEEKMMTSSTPSTSSMNDLFQMTEEIIPEEKRKSKISEDQLQSQMKLREKYTSQQM